MAKTRDNYQVSGNTLDEVKHSLNFLLQRIADRLDKIEGIRDEASIESGLDLAGDLQVSDDDGNVIHSLE